VNKNPSMSDSENVLASTLEINTVTAKKIVSELLLLQASNHSELRKLGEIAKRYVGFNLT